MSDSIAAGGRSQKTGCLIHGAVHGPSMSDGDCHRDALSDK